MKNTRHQGNVEFEAGREGRRWKVRKGRRGEKKRRERSECSTVEMQREEKKDEDGMKFCLILHFDGRRHYISNTPPIT